MARRQRDYRAEYARRIAKGLAEGKTRAQARGHGADTAKGFGVGRDISPQRLESYLGSLKDSRSVKLVATLADGSTREIARGKVGKLKGEMRNWTEWDAEGGPFEWDHNYRGDSTIVSVTVVYR